MPHIDELPPPEPPKPITITVTPQGDRNKNRRDPGLPKKKPVRRPRTQTINRLAVLGSQPSTRAKAVVNMMYEAAMDPLVPMEVRLKAAKEYLTIVMGPPSAPIKGRDSGQSRPTLMNFIGVQQPQPAAPALPAADLNAPPRSVIDQLPADVSLGDAGFSFDVLRKARNGTTATD